MSLALLSNLVPSWYKVLSILATQKEMGNGGLEGVCRFGCGRIRSLMICSNEFTSDQEIIHPLSKQFPRDWLVRPYRIPPTGEFQIGTST